MVQINELGNQALLKLWFFFARNPTQEFSYTLVRNKTKLAKATLRKWLNFLLKDNLIKEKKIGLTKLYSLNRENIVVKYFKILDNVMTLKILEETAKRFNCDIFLYGSLARGEDVEDSDIDLLVIGEADEQKIFGEIKSEINKNKIKREAKIQILSKIEWAQMERKDKAFYERVEKDKIKL